jgi:hypothetical protein
MTPDEDPKKKDKSGMKPETAFDIWLKRRLHEMFDDVAGEPIPEHLLRLIQGDSDKV